MPQRGQRATVLLSDGGTGAAVSGTGPWPPPHSQLTWLLLQTENVTNLGPSHNGQFLKSLGEKMKSIC